MTKPTGSGDCTAPTPANTARIQRTLCIRASLFRRRNCVLVPRTERATARKEDVTASKNGHMRERSQAMFGGPDA